MLTMKTQFGDMIITDDNQTLIDKKLADNITTENEMYPNVTIISNCVIDKEEK